MKPARPTGPYWLLAPTLLLLLLFFVVPFFIAAKESLFSWDLLTPKTYVGLANYTQLWERGELSRAFRNTLSYSAVVVAGALVLGLSLALLLDDKGRVAAFARQRAAHELGENRHPQLGIDEAHERFERLGVESDERSSAPRKAHVA